MNFVDDTRDSEMLDFFVFQSLSRMYSLSKWWAETLNRDVSNHIWVPCSVIDVDLLSRSTRNHFRRFLKTLHGENNKHPMATPWPQGTSLGHKKHSKAHLSGEAFHGSGNFPEAVGWLRGVYWKPCATCLSRAASMHTLPAMPHSVTMGGGSGMGGMGSGWQFESVGWKCEYFKCFEMFRYLVKLRFWDIGTFKFKYLFCNFEVFAISLFKWVVGTQAACWRNLMGIGVLCRLHMTNNVVTEISILLWN